jgi:hypothetical protein
MEGFKNRRIAEHLDVAEYVVKRRFRRYSTRRDSRNALNSLSFSLTAGSPKRKSWMHGSAQPHCWAGFQKQANFTRLSGSRSGETDPFEFRAEASNIFNHRIFGIPNNDVFSTNFGSVSGTANNPRQFQLNDKIVF